jgi:hypothetical protein
MSDSSTADSAYVRVKASSARRISVADRKQIRRDCRCRGVLADALADRWQHDRRVRHKPFASGPEAPARTPAHTLAATRSQITRRDDDRELQTEQTIVGLPAPKLQPDRMDALVVRDNVCQGVACVVCYGRGPLPARLSHSVAVQRVNGRVTRAFVKGRDPRTVYVFPRSDHQCPDSRTFAGGAMQEAGTRMLPSLVGQWRGSGPVPSARSRSIRRGRTFD